MRTRLILISAVLAMIGLVGCRKSDTSSGGANADGSQPVAGSAPKNASQFVGSWVHTTPVDIYGSTGGMEGLEFADNGKVMVYMGDGGDAMASDYALLNDGRLSLSMGGMTNFVLPTVGGDQLQFKEPDSGKVATFRRLRSGETMVAAIATQDQADRKAVAQRNAALPDLLRRQDLVMVLNRGAGGPNGGFAMVSGVIINGSKDAPPSAALEFAPANGNDYVGRAYYDGTPPRVEPIAARIEGGPEKPVLSMIFGPGTVDQNGGRGVVEFHPQGTAPNITLKASLDYGGPRLSDLVIKSDPNLRNQIVGHLKTEGARLNTLKEPVIAMLKDYAVLNGTSQSMTPSDRNGFVDQFILSRNPQNNTWMGQGQSVSRTTGATEIFPVVAAVAIANQKPVLQIGSQKRLYQFANIDTAGGKLSGTWQMPNNPNGRNAELAITQAVDAKARDQLFASRKTAMQQMSAGTVFHAILNDQYPDGSQPPNAVTVTLAAGAGGTFTGKAEYAMEGCTMDLSGKEIDTPLGPQLALQYTGGKANPGAWPDVAAFITLVQHERWLLNAAGDSTGPMRLSGQAVTNPIPGAAPISLELVPYTDADKAALVQTLTNGAKFKVTIPVMSTPDDILEFSIDPSTHKINGRVASGGNRIGAPTGTPFTGDIKDKAGWTELDMTVLRLNTSAPPSYGYTILVGPTDRGLYLNSSTNSLSTKPNRPLGRWDAVEVKPDSQGAHD
jgi:hypothetical protein